MSRPCTPVWKLVCFEINYIEPSYDYRPYLCLTIYTRYQDHHSSLQTTTVVFNIVRWVVNKLPEHQNSATLAVIKLVGEIFCNKKSVQLWHYAPFFGVTKSYPDTISISLRRSEKERKWVFNRDVNNCIFFQCAKVLSSQLRLRQSSSGIDQSVWQPVQLVTGVFS